jgi:hypothetical protein
MNNKTVVSEIPAPERSLPTLPPLTPVVRFRSAIGHSGRRDAGENGDDVFNKYRTEEEDWNGHQDST